MDNEWQRLQQIYAGLSDDELLKLAGAKAELTEVAQQAVGAEMGSRGLALPVEEDEVYAVPTSSVDDGEDQESFPAEGADDRSEAEKDPSLVELTTFHIATEAEKALYVLDDHGIPVTMEPAMRRLTEDGPRIKTNWLTIFVERTRHEEAKSVLRKTMGLFPVLAPNEFDEADGEEGEDVLLPVGSFDVKADVEIARNALAEAAIWFTTGEVDEDDDVTTIQVRAGDLDHALAVVEAAFEAAE